MNSISDKNFDILIIKDQLYIKRIKDEIEYYEKQIKENDNQEIKERLTYLNNIIKHYQDEKENKLDNNINKILEEKTNDNLIKEYKKTWGRMNINYKRIKINEFCDENKIDDETRNKYLKLLEEKQLKTKNVKYDSSLMKIIEIKI